MSKRLLAIGTAMRDLLAAPAIPRSAADRLIAEWNAAAQQPAKKEPAPPSERGMKFAAWAASGLVNMRVKQDSLVKWALCFDAMLTLDDRREKEIVAVWTFARNHDFYRKVVLTPLKLRQKDTAGCVWFDRLALAMTHAKPATPVEEINGREL